MKTSIEKRRKICTFCEGLVHGFGQKTEIFPSFVFMQNRPTKSVLWKTSRFSLWKPRLKNDAKLHFSKGVSPWFSSKKWKVFMKNRPRKSVLLIRNEIYCHPYVSLFRDLLRYRFECQWFTQNTFQRLYTPLNFHKKNHFTGFPLSALITLDWSNTDRLLFKKESVINRVCLAISKRATVTWKKLRS